ncbi:winged helix-turn-helix transcriptional regulator, partial [Burkholderia territorii]
MKRYEQLADDLQAQIERGVYRPGERIPSVRQASRQQQLSVTTVLRAYLVLESRGLIESRPQSGYFVRARAAVPAAAELHVSAPAAEPSA